MDVRSKVVDVSSFLLFEATGDSEAGCFDPAMSNVIHGEDHGDDDDDAESCSCDTASDFLPAGVRSLEDRLANVVGGDDHHHHHEDDDGDGDGDGDGEVVEQKEVHLYKKCRDEQWINGVAAKEKKPSAVPVDDSTDTMNEMEKNRLFWEACLAS